MTVKVELSDPINVVMYPSPRPLAKESLTQESDNALGPDDFVPAIKSGSVQAVVRPSLSYWKDAWIRIKKNPQAMFSLSLIVFMILFTVVGPWIWRVSPADQSINRISEAPTFNRMAKVIPDLPEWEESLVPGIAEHPDAAGAELPAPSSLDFIGEPSTQAVRLKWTLQGSGKLHGLPGRRRARRTCRPGSARQ